MNLLNKILSNRDGWLGEKNNSVPPKQQNTAMRWYCVIIVPLGFMMSKIASLYTKVLSLPNVSINLGSPDDLGSATPKNK